MSIKTFFATGTIHPNPNTKAAVPTVRRYRSAIKIPPKAYSLSGGSLCGYSFCDRIKIGGSRRDAERRHLRLRKHRRERIPLPRELHRTRRRVVTERPRQREDTVLHSPSTFDLPVCDVILAAGLEFSGLFGAAGRIAVIIQRNIRYDLCRIRRPAGEVCTRDGVAGLIREVPNQSCTVA